MLGGRARDRKISSEMLFTRPRLCSHSIPQLCFRKSAPQIWPQARTAASETLKIQAPPRLRPDSDSLCSNLHQLFNALHQPTEHYPDLTPSQILIWNILKGKSLLKGNRARQKWSWGLMITPRMLSTSLSHTGVDQSSEVCIFISFTYHNLPEIP